MRVRHYLAMFLLSASVAVAQKPNPVEKQKVPSQAEQPLHSAPGAIHKQMAARAGEYTTVTKFMPAPGGPSSESSGTATFRMALDGRFLIEESSGTMMGQANNGLRLWGYNNAAKRFEAVWTYTLSTAIMQLAGTSKDGGKTVEYLASFSDESGERKLNVTTRQVDSDHFSVELRTPDGKGPVLDTTYTRKN